MARSYLPSKVSEIVAIWKKDLNKVSDILFRGCIYIYMYCLIIKNLPELPIL